MALVLADRVKDTTTTTSTGTITLSGTAPTGFQNFSVIGDGNTTYYTIAGQGTSEWEVGIGTYTSSGTTLSRTTVLASSNGGSLVNFSAGTKDVFVTYPAERSVNLSSAALTSGRVPYATTDGLLVDAANLTFNGTTLTAAGFSGPLNGTVGATTAAAGTFTSLTDSGNLTFTGTGNRITGDFTNATFANRVAFQTSSANTATTVLALPSGSGTTASWDAYNNSDPTNSSYIALTGLSSETRISSSIRGTGTFLPMTFFTGGSERVRITSAGGVSFGATGTAYGTSGQVLTSAGNAPPTWATPSGGGAGSNIFLADYFGGF